MSAITITVTVYVVVTVIGSIQNVLLKALGRGELGLVEDPRSIYPHHIPHRPPADCDVCRPGVWPEIPLPVADKPGTAQLTPGPLPPPPPMSQDQVPNPHPPPGSCHPGNTPCTLISTQPAVSQAPVQVQASHAAGQPKLPPKATPEASGHPRGQRGVGRG